MVDTAVTRKIVEEVMEAVMAGAAGSIARHFVPGAMVSQRSYAAMSDAPWFGRMEGEFRLQGEEEARAFFDEMLKRTTYISYELRGIVCEDDNAASRFFSPAGSDDRNARRRGQNESRFTASSRSAAHDSIFP